MIHLGLCCIFLEQPIKFRTTTAAAMSRRPRSEALQHLSALCLANAVALRDALAYCAENEIGCFRVNSQILPLKTHPSCGYRIDELPNFEAVVEGFRNCGRMLREKQLRTSFHPDQFVVLNSQRPEVVSSSIAELEYQGEVAQWIGADVINLHGGGAFGDKTKALGDFERSLDRLPTEREAG